MGLTEFSPPFTNHAQMCSVVVEVGLFKPAKITLVTGLHTGPDACVTMLLFPCILNFLLEPIDCPGASWISTAASAAPSTSCSVYTADGVFLLLGCFILRKQQNAVRQVCVCVCVGCDQYLEPSAGPGAGFHVCSSSFLCFCTPTVMSRC